MARLTIALVLALLAVCVAAETIYTIDINGYSGTSCGGSAAFTTSYSNGTCGSNAQPIAFSTNASCSATGGSTGYFCQGTTICEGDSESCTFVDGATFEWGQEFCMPVTEGVFVGLTCQMEVVPTAPTAAPVEEPVAPTAPTAPTAAPTPAPVAPVAPAPMTTTPPADGALITAGNLTASFWAFSTSCASTATVTIPLFANYSKCQSYTYQGSTFYFRADCYITEFSKVSYCEDSTCSSCTDLQSTASNTCFPVTGLSILKSATVVCPIYRAPSAPTPSASAPLFASFAFVAAAVLAVAFF